MDKAFKNGNEAQGVGLILQPQLCSAEMRLTQGLLSAGQAHLLGILPAEGLPKDGTEPRAPKDISCPSTGVIVLAGVKRRGGNKKQRWPNQHFVHRTSLLMPHPSKGKESAREAGKPSSKALGKGSFFLSAFIWVGFFYEKQLEKSALLSSSSAGPQPLAAAGAPPSPVLPVPPQPSRLGSSREGQKLLSRTPSQHLYERFPLQIWPDKLQTRHRVRAEGGRKEAVALDPSRCFLGAQLCA